MVDTPSKEVQGPRVASSPQVRRNEDHAARFPTKTAANTVPLSLRRRGEQASSSRGPLREGGSRANSPANLLQPLTTGSDLLDWFLAKSWVSNRFKLRLVSTGLWLCWG